MVFEGDIVVPDKCPEKCTLRGTGYCERCPVFLCAPPVTEEDKQYLPVIEVKNYRLDWAKEWELFFLEGIPPSLPLVPKGLKSVRYPLKSKPV